MNSFASSRLSFSIRSLTLLAASLAAMLAACGGVSDGGDGAAGSSGASGAAGASNQTDMAAACRAVIASYQAARAHEPKNPRAAEIDALREAACVVQATMDGSTVKPADLEDCAAKAAAAKRPPSCLDYSGSELFPEHDRAGSLAKGAACHLGLQCASGSCSGSFEYGTCGVCREVREVGESCAPPLEPCEPGVNCEQGVCTPPGKKLGEPCTDFAGGDCQDGLFCDAPDSDPTDGVCKKLPAKGEACKLLPGCVTGLACIGHVCDEPRPDGASCEISAECRGECVAGTCRTPKDFLQPGEDCSIGACAPGLWCSEQKRCDATHAKKGEDCTIQPCAAGLLCDREQSSPTALRCVDEPAAGGKCVRLSCGPMEVCVSDGYPADAGTCEPRGFAGDSCPCVDGLVCQQDVCRAPVDSCQ